MAGACLGASEVLLSNLKRYLMDKAHGELELHVFICTNKKDGKECCADKEAEKLREDLKDWSKSNPEWRKKLRINSSGCLDRCKEGIAVAIYPDNLWFTHVEKSDAEDLKATITDLMNKRK